MRFGSFRTTNGHSDHKRNYSLKSRCINGNETLLHYFSIHNRRYLGSKRALLPHINSIIEKLTKPVTSAADLFAGTGMVGGALAESGINVTFNDLLSSNSYVHRAFYGEGDFDLQKLEKIVTSINETPEQEIPENYFSTTFSDTYFSRENCLLIGYYREHIKDLRRRQEINSREESILITSLIYGMDKKAATVGHYDAYRIGQADNNRIIFGLPDIKPPKSVNKILTQDANRAAAEGSWDLVYLDPPYNSRQYSDMYHLLENVATWEKKPVKHKALKIDRTHLKSDYCTSKAVPAFTDLIEKLNTKYILFSYNDTGLRGNSRSAARISDSEIIKSLERRGKVTIININHKGFTTGKSKIGDIKERLFLCEVEIAEELKTQINLQEKQTNTKTNKLPKKTIMSFQNSDSQPTIFDTLEPYREIQQIHGKTNLTKTPLNYTGNKNKLITTLYSHFPPANSGMRFIDLFAGGMSVGLNSGYPKVVFNDISPAVTALGTLFASTDYLVLENQIENIIDNFGLSKSSSHGYEFYGMNSSNGLGKYNKEPYLRLREYFNSLNQHNPTWAVYLFTLVIFSFNNQIRFNSAGNFNMPVGKRDFNNRVKANLYSTIQRLRSMDAEFWNGPFDAYQFTSNDFLYCDPPYLLGLASYNEQGAWTEIDDQCLGDFLVAHHNRGGFFALSNVLFHKGVENVLLREWANSHKFRIIELTHSYGNSSYQRKDRKPSIEALITNWKA